MRVSMDNVTCKPTPSGRASLLHASKPVLPVRCRSARLRTLAAAAVDTKQQSRLAFVDLQPPDPILGNDHHVRVLTSWRCMEQSWITFGLLCQ